MVRDEVPLERHGREEHMSEFSDKAVVVTGGLSGIGRAIAELFASNGASVAVFDTRSESRDDGVNGGDFANGLGRQAFFHKGDVTSQQDVAALFDLVLERLGGVDAVINSAGTTVFKPTSEITPSDYDLVMNVNVRGAFFVCQHAMEHMKRVGRGGTIVNVASNFGLVAGPETALYSASKGAVISMSKGLALEGGSHGIRVNALCPGATETEFNRAYLESRPDVVESWRSKTPLRIPGREGFLARASDIARAALFLASEGAIYMTGATLVCDGGWNAE
jgi:NAD(P)-dependent dehydrogenase (short-subunit alcohol dehydrogenase family)